MKPVISAIILGGGSSSRMSGVNKVLMRLAEIPVIIRSALVFQYEEKISSIVIASRECDRDEITRLCGEYGITKLCAVTESGTDRNGSVRGALAALPENTEYVAVHDGARPLVTRKIVENVLDAAVAFGGAIAAVPSKDTVKIAENGFVSATPPRDSLWLAQTPQAFRLDEYKKASYGCECAVTDDSSIFESAGLPVKIVMGSYENIKLTTPSDIGFAERIIAERNEKNA